jgi:hypothetical protein
MPPAHNPDLLRLVQLGSAVALMQHRPGLHTGPVPVQSPLKGWQSESVVQIMGLGLPEHFFSPQIASGPHGLVTAGDSHTPAVQTSTPLHFWPS